MVNRAKWITAFLLLIFLFITGFALAAGRYDLSSWTADGGGGASKGGNFTLHGTIGQPDASYLLTTSDGKYTLTGGFWSGSGSPFTNGTTVKHLYLPIVFR